MNSIRNFAASLRSDKRGMTTVEYVIALCLVGAVAVGMWKSLGTNVRDKLSRSNTLIETNADTAITTGETDAQ